MFNRTYMIVYVHVEPSWTVGYICVYTSLLTLMLAEQAVLDSQMKISPSCRQ